MTNSRNGAQDAVQPRAQCPIDRLHESHIACHHAINGLEHVDIRHCRCRRDALDRDQDTDLVSPCINDAQRILSLRRQGSRAAGQCSNIGASLNHTRKMHFGSLRVC